MNTVYIVYGHNNTWGHTILGLYPNEFTAQYRVDDIKEEGRFESVWYSAFDTGPDGVDLNITMGNR